MLMYIYSKCSTCKNALHFLKELEIHPIVREITQQPPTIDELTRMLHYQKYNLKKLFNTSGMLYREMELTKKLNDIPLQQALELLATHGMLVKRPFLLGKDFGIVGFNQKEYGNIVSKI